jgi:hypothetical protein
VYVEVDYNFGDTSLENEYKNCISRVYCYDVDEGGVKGKTLEAFLKVNDQETLRDRSNNLVYELWLKTATREIEFSFTPGKNTTYLWIRFDTPCE